MVNQNRMSPLTAFFLGVFGIGAVGIGASAVVVLYGMRIVDTKVSAVMAFVGGTVDGLPELIDALPPALADLLNDRRAPEYTANLDIDVGFVADEHTGRLRPVVSITNKGNEVVSLLAIRVAALNEQHLPLCEWTEVMATPIAIDNQWRGPLMPGDTRHALLSSWRPDIPADQMSTIKAATEISEIRVWRGSDPT